MSTIPPHDLETGQAIPTAQAVSPTCQVASPTYQVASPMGQVVNPMSQRQILVDQNGILLGQWKVGLFSCLDSCIPNCLMAWLCPCIAYAQIRHRMTGSFWGACCCFLLCNGLPIFCIRGEVRERFRIPGNACEDVCCALCCPICVLAQVATHTESYTPGSCDCGPKDVLLGYTV
ncbi:hypothetical protein SPRG_12205 [Saprolegnia parasitica CBS 223.65]|uniref:PLAC8 family protein n=1 Tax=Saprolegnia parasitica (strain CBS 223.65) TaxID=695850 RepID=A0A067BWZ5_SAPPC|nr:hypothetical protein SPRG_12205 [Saprolegnia parasitica CBS 223.65]KDO22778.1 hypothetical protein SPRG_12205 [Saprolegnia parasitica CBS 223.65]|eukprot:XP_012206562.1 hypothetical protein SPRG_12205 [Saprolegnia parasitica CBS 223.65]